MDLNVMMREQALGGLQRELDAAVTNGDTAEARKVSDKIAQLTAASAPKAPPFTGQDVYAVLTKYNALMAKLDQLREAGSACPTFAELEAMIAE